MFQFVGMDFFGGDRALEYVPTKVNNITSSRLSNAIFDHFNATKDTSIEPSVEKPTGWTYDTILNASFENTTSAGNLDYMVKQLGGIKIKRRVKGTFDWITLNYIQVEDAKDLIFTFNDFLNAYGVEYEYALVPVVNGVEGDYIIEDVMSKFSGVFIGDATQSFKFLYDVNYSSNARNQQIGTFTPLGRAYPIIVANGVLSYESGTFTGSILNDDFEKTGVIDRTATTQKKNRIKDYLTNKKPKILKDYNGNLWLIMITSNINVAYKSGTSMSIPQVSFSWTEIAKANNQKDLYDSGIVNILE